MEEVAHDVQSGALAYRLLRPYSYPVFMLYRSLGQTLVKLLPILAVGTGVSFAFVGPLPGALQALPQKLLLLGAVVLNTLWQLVIALLAFGFENVMPFRWIFQKVVFVAGGLFFPLDLLPDRLSAVAR